ncbi:MAG: glycosyltransferase [Xanthomonadales bacterium]|nr:glycosyltransferase [Xanthomonadales bacterium]
MTSRLPWPPQEGHQLRSWHLLRALAARHAVHLLSFERRDDRPGELAHLRRNTAAVETFPIPAEHSRRELARAALRGSFGERPFVAWKYRSAALRGRARKLLPAFDAVHVDMLPLVANLPRQCGLPLVLNAHNIEHALLERRSETERSPWRRRFLAAQVPRLRAFEVAAWQRADLVLACSPGDTEVIRTAAPRTRVEVIPNGVDLDANRPDASTPGPGQLVFVGQMGWFPNRDGVEWFLAEVFPRILAARPHVSLQLVGKPDGFAVPAALRGHVQMAGFVEDVRRPVRDAAVYVVPLRAGSGTRLKVLEAMALGKAIVTTSIGSAGIALQPGRDALFADDAASFATAVLELLADPARAARLGSAARAVAEARYGWTAIGESLVGAYDSLLASRAARQR